MVAQTDNPVCLAWSSSNAVKLFPGKKERILEALVTLTPAGGLVQSRGRWKVGRLLGRTMRGPGDPLWPGSQLQGACSGPLCLSRGSTLVPWPHCAPTPGLPLPGLQTPLRVTLEAPWPRVLQPSGHSSPVGRRPAVSVSLAAPGLLPGQAASAGAGHPNLPVRCPGLLCPGRVIRECVPWPVTEHSWPASGGSQFVSSAQKKRG